MKPTDNTNGHQWNRRTHTTTRIVLKPTNTGETDTNESDGHLMKPTDTSKTDLTLLKPTDNNETDGHCSEWNRRTIWTATDETDTWGALSPEN